MGGLMVRAEAKINLYLDIAARRDDGYHDIFSIMQTVSLCDDIGLERRESGVSLACSVPALEGEGNLAWRAARLFFERAGISDGVSIELVKRIPTEAGLGGGSSDAAAVLRGLNELFDRPLEMAELCTLGGTLGADVPFCVAGGCMSAGGIGDRLEMLPGMPECTVVLCCPPERISTPWAYRELDRMYAAFAARRPETARFDDIKDAMRCSQIKNIARKIYNIFEDVTANREDIQSIKRIMLECGALNAMMSGSGPSVFGLFENERQARMCADALASLHDAVYVCVPTAANNI